MELKETPYFSFERRGSKLICWFNNHPLLNGEGKKQWLGFTHECDSELEGEFLRDYMSKFEGEIHKHFFTEGYNAKKRKESNYYL